MAHQLDEREHSRYLSYISFCKVYLGCYGVGIFRLEESSQMFHLLMRSRNMKQEECSITRHFNSPTKLWQELDLLNQPSWKDPFDADLYKRMLSKDRIYDFLTSPNSSLDDVRGRILSLNLLPVVDVIFDETHGEEHLRKLCLVLRMCLEWPHFHLRYQWWLLATLTRKDQRNSLFDVIIAIALTTPKSLVGKFMKSL